MPSEAVAERILAAIVTTLDGVTAGADYHNTLTATRPKIANAEFRPENNVVQVSMSSLDPVEEGNSATDPIAEMWSLTVACDGYVRVSEDSTVLADTAILRMFHDIKKALFVDPQWSNLALYTTSESVQFFTRNDGGFEGVRVVVSVIHRTDENDPAQER